MARELMIVIHDSENEYCSPESLNGNAKYLRIILLNEDESIQEIFRGSEFSEEKWEARMKSRGNKPYLDRIKK